MNNYKHMETTKNLKESKQHCFSRHRIPSGCAIFGIVNESGKTFNGSMVLDGISMMHERSNGLGGGFAAYGIYPQFKKDWAFHIFYDGSISKSQTEDVLKENFKIIFYEEIPTKNKSFVKDPPNMYRYFLKLKNNFVDSGANKKKIDTDSRIDKDIIKEKEEDFIVDLVMKVNSNIKGAYIISSGKNMGIFKGIGYPEDIGQFYKIDDYSAYLWTSHGRFPTNSVGWWGGAHPFGLLNWSVVHNGEISSYGANKRFVDGFGYECTLSTDTEVVTYLFDLLVRKQKIDLSIIHLILASPLWEEIKKMPEDKREILKAFRILYSGALMNGPFSIIAANSDFMYALNDRIKLRPMVAAKKGNFLFVSSEEAAIRKVCSSPDILWHPRGGEPVIGVVNKQNIKNK